MIFKPTCAEGDVLATHPVIPHLVALIERTGDDEIPTVPGVWHVA